MKNSRPLLHWRRVDFNGIEDRFRGKKRNSLQLVQRATARGLDIVRVIGALGFISATLAAVTPQHLSLRAPLRRPLSVDPGRERVRGYRRESDTARAFVTVLVFFHLAPRQGPNMQVVLLRAVISCKRTWLAVSNNRSPDTPLAIARSSARVVIENSGLGSHILLARGHPLSPNHPNPPEATYHSSHDGS